MALQYQVFLEKKTIVNDFFLPEISSAFIQLVIIKQLLRNLDNGSV